MSNGFSEFFQSDPLAAIAALVACFVVYTIVGLLPLCGAIYGIHFLLTLPLRRNERARFFLDVLELGLKEGRTAEAAIAGAATSHDPALGVRFHWVAEYLGQGLRLGAALDLVPRLLPPQVRGMIKAGEHIGDIRKVLPACRQLLGDSVSQVRGALNYVILLAFVVTPLSVLVPLMIRIKIIPSYRAVFEGLLEGQPLPAFTRFVFAGNELSVVIQIAMVCILWAAMIAYVGGPRLRGWFNRLLPGLADATTYRLPWRRKRLERDFSALLAALLDAGVPEGEAITLAGDAAQNAVVRRRAARVRALLVSGVKLPEAILVMDRSGELGWRLSNALRRGSGFMQTLSGWCEALSARAFQQEQTAAQLATTALVLLNGLIVASIVIGIFLAFIQLLNQAVLW